MIRSLPVALLLCLSTIACEVAGPPDRSSDPDAAPEVTKPPQSPEISIPDVQPVVYSSCAQIAEPHAALSDEKLDALLARLSGAPCEGQLLCETGLPQNCGSGYNPYSTSAIGCQCLAGRLSCRDYRAEARACGAMRSADGGSH